MPDDPIRFPGPKHRMTAISETTADPGVEIFAIQTVQPQGIGSPQDDARIHPCLRVECPFDPAHEIQ